METQTVRLAVLVSEKPLKTLERQTERCVLAAAAVAVEKLVAAAVTAAVVMA